jgi:hypothetical protein
LRFEGYSDDTFGEYGRTNQDHDDAARGTVRVYRVSSGEDAVNVTGQYMGPGGGDGWTIGVQLVDEERPFPPWPIRYCAGSRPYTPALVVEAPADAVVELIEPKERA